MTNLVRGIIAICVIALLGLGAFAFTQFNTLTETQNNLADVETAGTAIADTLNTANDNIDELTTNLDAANAEITQVIGERDTANAEITEVSSNLDAANAEITQAVSDLATANAEITQAVDAANSSATQSADDMATANAELDQLGSSLNLLSTQNANVVASATAQTIQSADDLATANAEITQAVESAAATATQAAIELADAQATIAALNIAATTSADFSATQASDLATAQAPSPTQVPPTETEDATTSDVQVASLKDGFVLFEASDFDLYVPEDFIVYDLRTNQEEAVDAFSKLGLAYSGIEYIASLGGLYIVTGASDTPNADGTLDNLLITNEILPFSMEMEAYLEMGAQLFPAALEIIEQSVITINGEDVGLMRTQINDGLISIQQLIYVYNVDDVIYSFAYTTNVLADRRAEFEASLRSFVPRD